MEGQARTRNSRVHYIGIPDCFSPPRLGPGDFVFAAGSPSQWRLLPSPSFLTMGRRGHTVRPPSSWTCLVATGPRLQRPDPEEIALGSSFMTTPCVRGGGGLSPPYPLHHPSGPGGAMAPPRLPKPSFNEEGGSFPPPHSSPSRLNWYSSFLLDLSEVSLEIQRSRSVNFPMDNGF